MSNNTVSNNGDIGLDLLIITLFIVGLWGAVNTLMTWYIETNNLKGNYGFIFLIYLTLAVIAAVLFYTFFIHDIDCDCNKCNKDSERCNKCNECNKCNKDSERCKY